MPHVCYNEFLRSSTLKWYGEIEAHQLPLNFIDIDIYRFITIGEPIPDGVSVSTIEQWSNAVFGWFNMDVILSFLTSSIVSPYYDIMVSNFAYLMYGF